jgi:hypothetical protein
MWGITHPVTCENLVVARIAIRKNRTVLVRQPLTEVIHACIAISTARRGT